MKTGGTKRDTKTPRPATTTKPQNAIEAVDKLKQAIDDLIEERDCYHEQLNEAQKEAKEWKRVADGLREDYGYMEYTTDKLKEKLREALKAIKQGRIAFDDGQDMTDWFVSTAELQATIESILAKQEGVTDECE
jgi:chromosome segregation ATPase